MNNKHSGEMYQDAGKKTYGGYFYTVPASIAPAQEDILHKKP